MSLSSAASIACHHGTSSILSSWSSCIEFEASSLDVVKALERSFLGVPGFDEVDRC